VPVSFAILLDGGFLRRKLGTARQPVDAAGISTFTTRVIALPCVAALRLHRIYFYDAKPIEGVATIPLGGGQVDFSANPVAARNKSVQALLSREPFFALRFGELFNRAEHPPEGRRHADRPGYRQPEAQEAGSGHRAGYSR
jgi:hypothetical protein